jgi:acid phosphatase family membrane protein YuiD
MYHCQHTLLYRNISISFPVHACRYDAVGLRLHSGRHAAALNLIIAELPAEHPINPMTFGQLREQLGHTLPQVSLLGNNLGSFAASRYCSLQDLDTRNGAHHCCTKQHVCSSLEPCYTCRVHVFAVQVVAGGLLGLVLALLVQGALGPVHS